MNFKENLLRKKFIFALFVIILAAIVCWRMHYAGEVFRDMVIGVSGLFLGAQAYVDAKVKKEGDNA